MKSGELGLDEQAMLLKAIEENASSQGSDKEVASDFQLIAGTHRDLAEDVRAGRFREDLFLVSTRGCINYRA